MYDKQKTLIGRQITYLLWHDKQEDHLNDIQ